ncbi:MAG: exonuclease [Nitrososphaerales archaeon]
MRKVNEKAAFLGDGKKVRILQGNGIAIETPSFTIALDPRKASSCDYTFVSHAHIDHVHAPAGNSKVLASKETARLAGLRGYNLGETQEEANGMELFDSGHILGSKAILIDDRVLYTGDISSRDRAFLKGYSGVRCETLIMETTYGRQHYIFPDTQNVIREVNLFISRSFDKGRPVILTGYPLGKAQLISYFFENWEPVYLHDSVHAMNSAYINLGIDLPRFAKFQVSAEFDLKLNRGPWLMIAPMSSGRSDFVKSMRQKYNASVGAFSGWSMDQGYKYRMGLDGAFAVSDHCDFKELVELVRHCNPSMVYTLHGFAEEFANHLRTLGFEAEPLSREIDQEKITNYA